MEWGNYSEFANTIKESLGHAPSAFEQKPELYDDLTYLFDAFAMLSTSRNIGMSVGYIPLSEIIAYADFFNIGDKEEFIKYIQAADSVYVEHANRKQSKK